MEPSVLASRSAARPEWTRLAQGGGGMMGRAVAFSGGMHDMTENPLAKLVIGGGVTIVFETLLGGHALEFAKIAKQTTHDPYPVIFRRMVEHKGLIGVLDGFFPWGFIQCLTKGAVFSWGQAQAMSMLADNNVLSPEVTTVLTGGIGGFVQGVVMSPMLLLKTRVMTDPIFRKGMSAWETSVQSTKIGATVIQREGVMGLTKGMWIFASKRFLDWTTRYGFVVYLEHLMKQSNGGKKLSESQKIVASLAGGSLSALSTIPMDVMVATIQQASKAGQSVSIVDTFKQQIAAGTIFQKATSGLVARVAHVALTTLLMKQISSMVYDVFYRKH